MKRLLPYFLFAGSVFADETVDLHPYSDGGRTVLSYPVLRAKYMAQPSWVAGEGPVPLPQEAACKAAIKWMKAKYPQENLWVCQVFLSGDVIEKHKWHYIITFRGFPRSLEFGKDITDVVVLFDGSVVEPVNP